MIKWGAIKIRTNNFQDKLEVLKNRNWFLLVCNFPLTFKNYEYTQNDDFDTKGKTSNKTTHILNKTFKN